MEKRIAFLQPLICEGNYTPPLGALTLAAVMESEGWEARFFDERLDPEAIEQLYDFHPSIVGMSAVTGSVLRVRELATEIKSHLPDLIIIVGGPHATVMGEEVVRWDAVDFAVAGEGEDALRELGEWAMAGRDVTRLTKIRNISYLINGAYVHNQVAEFRSSAELDRLPMPAFHLLDMDRVFEKTRHGLFQRGKRILPVMWSRGCPNQCTFCCRIMGSAVRCRNPVLMVGEIERMIDDYGVDELWFEDDNFTADRVRAHGLLELLLKRGIRLHIKFANGVRADGVDSELLRKMERIGCYAISFGIDSGCARTLMLMKKRLSLERARDNVRLARSMGFLVGANCIVGYPGEDQDSLEESLTYFMNLRLHSMAMVNIIPFPGTEVRRICETKGYLTVEARNWNNYIFDIRHPRILVETEMLDRTTLTQFMRRAYRRFYLQPDKLWTMVKNMRIRNVIEGVRTIMGR